MLSCVKHLNPRQGITTAIPLLSAPTCTVKCETPKSPPGDYNPVQFLAQRTPAQTVSVKHLNPRQGITTELTSLHCPPEVLARV